MKKLLNSFSIQMLKRFPCNVRFTEIERPENLEDFESFVGHADTASILGVKMNRGFATIETDDEIVVAQLIGGRLPEGSTTLPEGFSFKFVKVELKESFVIL